MPTVTRRPSAALRLLALVTGLGAFVGLPTVARAQTGAPQHAVVTLVSEDASLKPGAPVWVGVLFEMEPGWHIYWVNPGDAGDPPRVKWELPAGFKANDIRWPVPVRLTLGPVIDYGYEGRVLLALPIDVPADYKAGTAVTLAADVRYVICKDVCIPARSRVSLALPAAAGSGPASRRALFTETRGRWPQTLPPGATVTASAKNRQLTLTVNTGKSEPSASFFPLDLDQIDNAAPQKATGTPTGVQLALQPADPDGPALTALRGVLVLGGGRAYEIKADVK